MPSASVVSGIWTIQGTKAADALSVDRDPNHVGMLRAYRNGRLVASRSESSVQEIRLAGLGGNDTLRIIERHGAITTKAVLLGGGGKNRLVGGSGPTVLDGGPTKSSILQVGTGPTTLSRGIAADATRQFGTLRAFREFLGRSASKVGAGVYFRAPARGGVVAPNASPTAGAAPGAVPDHSTTNVQVPGVDEADIVETNGSHLFILSRNELVIVDSRTPDALAVASRIEIEGSPLAEFLDGTRLTVISSTWDHAAILPAERLASPATTPALWARGVGRVKVTTVDVSDPAAPTVVREVKLDGNYSDARVAGGKLYLVLQSDLFAGYWGRGGGLPVSVKPGRPNSASGGAATLADAPITSILPGFTAKTTAPGGGVTTQSGLISRAEAVYQPVSGDEANLISVVVLDTQGVVAAPIGTASILGSYASTLHVTADSLYIFAPRWDDDHSTTSIYQFALGAADPGLVATGSVPGSLINQYAADASGGYLRVATTDWNGGTSTSGLYVLQNQGRRLNVVGKIEGLAPGESLQAARFAGDRAYLVTFERVDPLWGIDLSVPTAPKVVGELVLPGFSRFLQPIGTDYLLGIGRDADPLTGRTTDLKISLFDVRDLSRPTLVTSRSIAPVGTDWTWSNAEWDPHAFGWFPEWSLLAIPVEGAGRSSDDAWISRSDLYVFQVDASAGIDAFRSLGTVSHTSSVLRSVRINDVLYSIAADDLKAVRVLSGGLDPLGTLTIQTAYDDGYDGPIVAL